MFKLIVTTFKWFIILGFIYMMLQSTNLKYRVDTVENYYSKYGEMPVSISYIN